MKQVCLLILLASLTSSCGSPYFSVGTKDGNKEEYRLLSVRDSSVVLLKSGKDIIEGMRDHRKIIPMDSIISFYRPASSGVREIFLGMLLGDVAGSIVGAVTGAIAFQGNNLQGQISPVGVYVILGGVVGLVVGGIVGWFLHDAEQNFYPPALHKEEMRRESRYPEGEPQWLQQTR